MHHESIMDRIGNEIAKKIKRYTDQLEKETDIVKQAEIYRKILVIQQKIFIQKIKELSKKEFDELIEDFAKPTGQNMVNLTKKAENLAYSELDSPDKFDSYRKTQQIREKLGEDMLKIIDDADMKKRDLERYLLILLILFSEKEIEHQNLLLELTDLISSTQIVTRVFGYDHNWLIGMALIQLHENMIKSKYDELGGKIEKNMQLPEIISQLIGLVKHNEGRDITLALDMSHGLKQLRNRMTHSGFKYNITPEQLKNLLKEIKRLEMVLFPENKQD